MAPIHERFNTKSVAAQVREQFPEIEDPGARRFLGDVLFSWMAEDADPERPSGSSVVRPERGIDDLVGELRDNISSLPLLAGVAPEKVTLEHLIEGTLAYHHLFGEEEVV